MQLIESGAVPRFFFRRFFRPLRPKWALPLPITIQNKRFRRKKNFCGRIPLSCSFYFVLVQCLCAGTISLRRIARTEATAAAVRTTMIVRSGVITICKVSSSYSWLFDQKLLLSGCSFLMFIYNMCIIWSVLVVLAQIESNPDKITSHSNIPKKM